MHYGTAARVLTFLLTFGAPKGRFGRFLTASDPDGEGRPQERDEPENPIKKALFLGKRA